jgi:hypothetical protein
VRVRSGSAGAGLRKLSVEVHEDDLRQITVSLVCGDQHSPNPLLFLSGASREERRWRTRQGQCGPFPQNTARRDIDGWADLDRLSALHNHEP